MPSSPHITRHETIRGLVARYMLDEQSGSYALDTSGTADPLHGTYQGTPGVAPAKVTARSVKFAGTSQFVTIPSNARIKTALPVTVMAWVNISSFAANTLVFGSDGAEANYRGFWLITVTNQHFQAGFGDNTGTVSGNRRSKESSTVIPTNTWTHIAATIRGSTNFSLYFNGVDDGGTTSGSGGAINYGTGVSKIGNWTAFSWPLPGQVNDVRIYNRDLSADEVKSIAVRGLNSPAENSFMEALT